MTIAPSETLKLARKLLGPPDPDRGDWYWRRKRSPKTWDETMLANWRAIWDLGEVAYRYAVLFYVGKHKLRELWRLCWEALEAPDYEGMLHGTAIVYLSSEVRSRRLTSAQTDALLRVIRTEKSHSTRHLALMILDWKHYAKYSELLDELSQDSSPEVAFEANLELRQRGFDTLDSMLDEIPYFEYPRDALDRVWGLRRKLRLTENQQARLMTQIARHTVRVRHKFWQFPDLPSAIELHEYLSRGIAIEASDIDDIGRAVFRYKEERSRTTGYRIRIVEAVAWFANDRARDWLQAIRDAETLPKTVRNAAKRELRKLESPSKPRKVSR